MKNFFSKNKIKSAGALILTASLCLASIAWQTPVVNAEKVKQNSADSSRTNKEIVYIVQNADGTEKQRIVNNDGELKYNGFEACKTPVNMSIHYTLGGKELTAKELKGKSGHLAIDIVTTNNYVNGSYVPFMVVSGMILPEDNFSNISFPNGKVIEQGENHIAMGAMLPGLKENIGLSQANINIGNSIHVEMDVKDFKPIEIYSYVSNQIFRDVNMGEISGLSDLEGKIDELKGSASKLAAGTEQLKTRSKELAKGANALADASKDLEAGAKQLNDGSSVLAIGTGKLAQGTKGEVARIDSAKAKVAAYLKQHNTDISTMKTQLKGLEGIVKSMMEDQSQNEAQLNAGLTQLWAAYDAATEPQIKAGYRAKIEDLEQKLGVVKQTESMQKNLSGMKDGITAALSALDSLDTDTTDAIDQYDVLLAKIGELEKNVRDLNDGAQQINGGVNALNTGSSKLYQGMKQFSTKEFELAKGADKLAAGATELNSAVDGALDQAKGELAKLSKLNITGIIKNLNRVSNSAKNYDSFEPFAHYDEVEFIYKVDVV